MEKIEVRRTFLSNMDLSFGLRFQYVNVFLRTGILHVDLGDLFFTTSFAAKALLCGYGKA